MHVHRKPKACLTHMHKAINNLQNKISEKDYKYILVNNTELPRLHRSTVTKLYRVWTTTNSSVSSLFLQKRKIFYIKALLDYYNYFYGW